ncbi:hypothetical protein EMIHUDRAFT_238109 [Emiliania huxleyi CCMP1516]|uniref:Uncharacterized protein n=2 Tax=Emiliania huxleyi TaxID=2903 RepID=A0A0D3JN39_EMIH1|nr:hypothetical protein EMIHUDRAFT_238109 [Emiliania huxleyi CCMP1516]EOD24924.1 hypothetical protein EMIHUDRAFT_238109 [Emiliania huxleyi CCMP1516]|eukprot:XP_005777353.1 hypothetical protein EMIHUDRAFT_238109 [Emiliania huxleyi CCMP1516]
MARGGAFVAAAIAIAAPSLAGTLAAAAAAAKLLASTWLGPAPTWPPPSPSFRLSHRLTIRPPTRCSRVVVRGVERAPSPGATLPPSDASQAAPRLAGTPGPEAADSPLAQSWDVAIGADVTYNRDAWPVLFETIEAARDAMRKAGLAFELVDSPMRNGYGADKVKLFWGGPWGELLGRQFLKRS